MTVEKQAIKLKKENLNRSCKSEHDEKIFLASFQRLILDIKIRELVPFIGMYVNATLHLQQIQYLFGTCGDMLQVIVI